MNERKEARVLSVNISAQKGVVKQPVSRAELNERGLVGDAHSGPWHRQVSLLSRESIARFEKELGRSLSFGEFAENITTEGVDLSTVSVRDRFEINDVVLEVTQIGKRCHGSGCSIFKEVGKCVMPKEGIFCRVVKGGQIHVGDAVAHLPRDLRAAVITLSDRASRGEYEDRSGPMIEEMLQAHFQLTSWRLTVQRTILPDDAALLRDAVLALVEAEVDILFTTGGTGIGPKDITPETLLPMFDKEIPGIMDFVRMKYGAALPQALMSRSVAGVLGNTQIFALPGSVKAVKEYTAEILKVVEHNVYMLCGFDIH